MPSVPGQLIRPWWSFLEQLGQDPRALVAGTQVDERAIHQEDACVSWREFQAVLRRFSWMTGVKKGLQQSAILSQPAKSEWHNKWLSTTVPEDLIVPLQGLFETTEQPAILFHLIHTDWNRILFRVQLVDGCEAEPLLFCFLEQIFQHLPAHRGIRLNRLDMLQGTRDATYSMVLQPSGLSRWRRTLQSTIKYLIRFGKHSERLQLQQRELQESLEETLQAHSRTRTLNLVGLDLAECTELTELTNALARSLNAHLLATGLTLRVESGDPSQPEPFLISRGIPSSHSQIAELHTAQGKVGQVQVWMEKEAIHTDLLEELAPWIAISVQNARAFQIIRQQKQQIVEDFEQAQIAAQAQQQLEQQVLRAQKLESLGNMASGIAHDFNNLLVGILSQAQLAENNLPSDSPAHQNIGKIIQTSRKATQLTEQMLVYSGEGSTQFERLNCSEVIQDIAQLLHTSLPKKVSLDLHLDSQLSSVDIDPEQLRQLILALVQNGADSIGSHPGRVLIRCHELEPQEALAHTEVYTNRLPRGRAVVIEVHDTGRGLDQRSRKRIFDPFFNAHGAGKGLGLATVLGIVRRHRGALCVQSEPGKGARYKVLLPRSIQSSQKLETAPSSWRGEGTVLVVDDEEVVRESLCEMLKVMGFHCWVAVDGEQALSTVTHAKRSLRALILDWNMPALSGVEVFEKIRLFDADIPVILTSAYPPDARVLALQSQGNLSFLRKPFTMNALKNALDQSLQAVRTA